MKIPKSYNYIGVFLTFSCNLKCSYCINRYDKLNIQPTMSGIDWISSLNKIETTLDLPITLQGGEPTLHPDFYEIVMNVKKPMDLLTNLQFNVDTFMNKIPNNIFKRDTNSISIRVSYHPTQQKLEELIQKAKRMVDAGYSIGIWTIEHPTNKYIKEAKEYSESYGVKFNVKEFLGIYDGKLYGTYKYKDSVNSDYLKNVKCKTSELLISSNGNIHRCHHDLYNSENIIENILNNKDINNIYRECNFYGCCNPCDVKIKTDRFQKYGHTPVDIII